MQGITFRGDMTVDLIKHAASDADVIWAAAPGSKIVSGTANMHPKCR